jgi:hypothetical protein
MSVLASVGHGNFFELIGATTNIFALPSLTLVCCMRRAWLSGTSGGGSVEQRYASKCASKYNSGGLYVRKQRVCLTRRGVQTSEWYYPRGPRFLYSNTVRTVKSGFLYLLLHTR